MNFETYATNTLVSMHALDEQTRRTMVALQKIGAQDGRIFAARVEMLAHTRAARALARRLADAPEGNRRILAIAVGDAVDLASDRAQEILNFAHEMLAA